MPIRSGVCSISFRGETIEAIVCAAADAGLEGIEWGGDVHVPPGDMAAAERAAALCRLNAVAVSSYGSYYRAGSAEHLGQFPQVLQTAQAMGAPCIRVWAGAFGSLEANEDQRCCVADDLRRCADAAAREGIMVAAEFHGHTLCDTADSAVRLAKQVDHPAFRLYWQPPIGLDVAEMHNSLERVQPWLANLHVFTWRLTEGRIDRRPLQEGECWWPELLQLAKRAPATHARWALLEFLHDDRLDTLQEAAVVLHRWLRTSA